MLSGIFISSPRIFKVSSIDKTTKWNMNKNKIKSQKTALKIIFLVVIALIHFSCEKENNCENSQKGILKNLTGLDGCGWIIQLSDSTMLEPINLEDFDIELIENKSVCIRFHERTDLGSYCMVGKVVEIESIE